MILITVGSQAPFDRLVRAADSWAQSRARSGVFAQIANGQYVPRHCSFVRFVDPPEFRSLMQRASLIVAHAGMGSIISSLELGKPIVVMPRRACFRETRNDHQVAATQRFGAIGRVVVAEDERQLAEKIDFALTLGNRERISSQASPQLITAIRRFIEKVEHSR